MFIQMYSFRPALFSFTHCDPRVPDTGHPEFYSGPHSSDPEQVKCRSKDRCMLYVQIKRIKCKPQCCEGMGVDLVNLVTLHFTSLRIIVVSLHCTSVKKRTTNRNNRKFDGFNVIMGILLVLAKTRMVSTVICWFLLVECDRREPIEHHKIILE